MVAVQMRNENALERRERQIRFHDLVLRPLAAVKQPPFTALIELQRERGDISAGGRNGGGGPEKSEFHRR